MTDVGEYQRLAVRSYPARAERETAEGRYWRRFKAPTLVQQVRAAPASVLTPPVRVPCVFAGLLQVPPAG